MYSVTALLVKAVTCSYNLTCYDEVSGKYRRGFMKPASQTLEYVNLINSSTSPTNFTLAVFDIYIVVVNITVQTDEFLRQFVHILCSISDAGRY